VPITSKPNRPLWTEEFSVHASEDKFVLRRQFSKHEGAHPSTLETFLMNLGQRPIPVSMHKHQANSSGPIVFRTG
jgi:hypothetical protein